MIVKWGAMKGRASSRLRVFGILMTLLVGGVSCARHTQLPLPSQPQDIGASVETCSMTRSGVRVVLAFRLAGLRPPVPFQSWRVGNVQLGPEGGVRLLRAVPSDSAPSVTLNLHIDSQSGVQFVVQYVEFNVPSGGHVDSASLASLTGERIKTSFGEVEVTDVVQAARKVTVALSTDGVEAPGGLLAVGIADATLRVGSATLPAISFLSSQLAPTQGPLVTLGFRSGSLPPSGAASFAFSGLVLSAGRDSQEVSLDVCGSG